MAMSGNGSGGDLVPELAGQMGTMGLSGDATAIEQQRTPVGGRGRGGGRRGDGTDSAVAKNGGGGLGNGRGPSLMENAAAARVLKIGGSSRVKNIAGAIAHVTRAGGPPKLLALGASPVNICVKATAIANGYLVNDNISLVVVPQFREGEYDGVAMEGGPKPLAFVLHENVFSAYPDATSGKEPYVLTVASSSRAGVLAGAIAGKVREQLQPILKGIGAESVHIAMRAVAIAQQYLEEDGIMVCVVPEFKMERPKKETTGGIQPDARTVMVMNCYPLIKKQIEVLEAV